MQRLNVPSSDLTEDLPRVLLENYLLLSAALENQNLGRLQDMLQYQQKVHHNLLEVVQHIADAPAVAMTTSHQPAASPQLHEHSQQHSQEPDDPYMQEQEEAIAPAAVAEASDRGLDVAPQHDSVVQLQDQGPSQQLQQLQLQQMQQQGPPLPVVHLQDQGPRHQHQQQQLQHQGHPLPVVQVQEQGPPHQHQQQQLQQQGLPLPVVHLQEQGPPHQHQQHQLQQQGPRPPSQQKAVPFWLPNVSQPVGQLLQQLGLSQFGPLLEQQHVDLAALQLMDESHMRELGLPLGAVVKIKAALSSHQQAQQQ